MMIFNIFFAIFALFDVISYAKDTRKLKIIGSIDSDIFEVRDYSWHASRTKLNKLLTATVDTNERWQLICYHLGTFSGSDSIEVDYNNINMFVATINMKSNIVYLFNVV